MSPLSLRPLRLSDEADAQAAHEELAAEGFDFLLDQQAGEPWASYVRRLNKIRRGHDPPDRVPATFLVAEVDGTLVGRVSIRHELNDFLANFGGHIGYGVAPRIPAPRIRRRCCARHLSSPAAPASAACS